MTRRAPRLLLLAALVAAAGCKERPAAPATGLAAVRARYGDPPLAAADLPAEPLGVDLGPSPIRNPLNVYDMMIEGAPRYEAAGAIDGVMVTTGELDAQSIGALTRVGERVYEARDRGWRWLLERSALERLARDAGMALVPFLERQYARLPAPGDAELAPHLARVRELAPEERARAARSLWRIEAWAVLRSVLVHEGLGRVPHQRIQQRITPPVHGDPTTVEAVVDGREVTRAEMRHLAGYQEEIARREWWRIAKMQFDTYVGRTLVEREARRLGITPEELERREVAALGAPTEAELATFLRENPEYATDPKGRERARDQLRRLREIRGREALDARLRGAARIELQLKEPEFPRYAVDVPAPRRRGDPSAPVVIHALHGLGCDNCARGSKLVLLLLRKYDGRVRLVAGDYFGRGRLSSYRGALALRCGEEQEPEKAWALFARLVDDFGKGEVGELATRAAEAGLDRAAFTTCMDEDRYLPAIFENVGVAERIGLERNVAGIWVNGVRIGDLAQTDEVIRQVEAALALPPLPE